MDQSPDAIFERFSAGFENDLDELSNASAKGRARVHMRHQLKELIKFSGYKLDLGFQVLLFQSCAKTLVGLKEHYLADECFDHILNTLQPEMKASASPDSKAKMVAIRAETIYSKCSNKYAELLASSNYSRIAPIMVTQLLVLLQELRGSLTEIFEELSTKQQEESAWLILNGCKVILTISQPLCWLSCGKYVTETIMFAALCMESVVNLCTTKHLKFRMKLYTTCLYTAISSGSNDDSQRVLDHISKNLCKSNLYFSLLLASYVM